MAIIDLSTLARKTPEGRLDPAELARTMMGVSYAKVYTGRDAKEPPPMTRHLGIQNGYEMHSTLSDEQPICLAYRLASCLACRRPIFVDSPRRPCGARSHHVCAKEVAA